MSGFDLIAFMFAVLDQLFLEYNPMLGILLEAKTDIGYQIPYPYILGCRLGTRFGKFLRSMVLGE